MALPKYRILFCHRADDPHMDLAEESYMPRIQEHDEHFPLITVPIEVSRVLPESLTRRIGDANRKFDAVISPQVLQLADMEEDEIKAAFQEACVTPEEFRALASAIAPFIRAPRSGVVRSPARIGPLNLDRNPKRAKCFYNPGQAHNAAVLSKDDVGGLLGMGVTGFEPQPVFCRGMEIEDFVELRVTSFLELDQALVQCRECPRCGQLYSNVELPTKALDSIESPSLFYVVGRHELFSTEQFVRACQSLGLKGVRFVRVEGP